MLLDCPPIRRTLSAELVAGCRLVCPACPGKKRGQPFRITQSQLREVAVNIGLLALKIKLYFNDFCPLFTALCLNPPPRRRNPKSAAPFTWTRSTGILAYSSTIRRGNG